MKFDSIINWFKSNLPNFENETDRITRTLNISKYSRFCFIFATCFICFFIPLWHFLSLTRPFFRSAHILKHHILKRGTWIHRLPIYHNQSLRICLFWFTICVIGTFYNTGRDLVQITKRMGRIAVALMPPLLFLTLRPSPLPQTLYLSLLPFHKWLSRIVVLESLLHTIFYSYYMCWKGAFLLKMKKPANLYGVLAMVLFALIGITSIWKVRRLNFRLFYYVHYICTWSTVFLLHFHARPGIPYYTTLNCCILVYQIAYRAYHTSLTKFIVIPLSPNLTVVEFPTKDLVRKPILPSCHVRVNICHGNFIKRWISNLIRLQHPFTLASLPTDETARLIIRNGRFPLRNGSTYYITGSYEPILNFITKPTVSHSWRIRRASLAAIPSPMTYIINARRVLICVGGSAIAFGLPLLRILKFNGVNVRLIWVCRDYRDLKLLQYFKHNSEGLEVYISGQEVEEQDIDLDYSEESERETEEQGTLAENISLLRTGNDQPNTKRNFGSMNAITSSSHDEIDFTGTYTPKNKKSFKNGNGDKSDLKFPSESAFRDPVVIDAPSTNLSPASLSITQDEEASPKLSCPIDSKIKIPSGVKVFYGRPTLNNEHYAWCLETECPGPITPNSLCNGDIDSSGSDSHISRLSEVWVVAAGPQSLVESTGRWATDGGLRFHAESFAV
ncbi:hypothetical protein KAFR_0E02040 [Kazachstania africana CBS 2517]|uniref:Ferric oxidoreductase domain-containing protein n=1 Tax=Kazachstania africana (strain ATCC 22294 / BCRC 22015 / CBS 2517 / CECT 1963 / NBRC 1671 / NRRL Y-8276) TaxID=1071382 RepID=H2AVF7_KAZAF|nr:hypothetical protein KAFR_0E02040 [Kazachstania africana CBS 2517]CCF58357.1 hypothetical protein KAFR_0E02040 [Kazachstania africana CBS 2517]